MSAVETTSYRSRNGTNNGYHRNGNGNGNGSHTGGGGSSSGYRDRDWSRRSSYPNRNRYNTPSRPSYNYNYYHHHNNRRYNNVYRPHYRYRGRPWYYNWWDSYVWPWINPVFNWFWPNIIPATYASPYSPPIIYP